MHTRPKNATNLVRFLIARIDDESEQLRDAQRRIRRGISSSGAVGTEDLSRQQAECEAKRDVIGQAQNLLVLRDLPSEQPVREAATHMLQALAKPYEDHRSYRAEWLSGT